MTGRTEHKLSELLEEKENGLRLYAETAWGWSSLKVAPFLRQVAAQGNGNDPIVIGYCDIRKDGGITLKIPNRV